MQFIPIKTRVMEPPQDDLYTVLDEYVTDVREGDVVLITSKVVAIHQGRCLPFEGTDKARLIEEEADVLIDRPYAKWPMTIKYHTFLASAGIDESNSGDYYALLPNDPFGAAKEIWEYLKKKHNLENVGVIITDSHLQPLRWGVIGVSIGSWGFHPLEKHRGKKDLFGREMQVSSTNIAEALAAGAGLVAGESHECRPVIIARDVPYLNFSDEDLRDELIVDPKEDMYRVLFEKFLD